MRRWLIVLCGVSLGCSALSSKDGAISMRPAHWIDRNDRMEPVFGDFTFDGLDFVGPDDGWIVGNRFVVHVRGRELEMTSIHDTGIWLSSVDVATPRHGWAAGFDTDTKRTWGGLLELTDHGWTQRALRPISAPHWWIREVRESPAGEVWAVGVIYSEDAPAGERYTDFLVRRQEEEWQLVEAAPGLVDVRIGGICFYPHGTDGWMVGSYRDPSLGRTALTLRWRDGAWARQPLPERDPHRLAFGSLRCLPDGTAVVIGTQVSGDDKKPRVVISVSDGEWRDLPLPAECSGYEIEAVAGATHDDLWVVVDAKNPCGVRFLHWQHGSWSEAPPPVLPEGRCPGGYSVTDMTFPTADRGWAIANDVDGPGLMRGLIFEYENGVWRNRNWNWHFWNAPWFDLFGE